jgi:TonB family protein
MPALASAESLLLTYALNALWQVPLVFAAAWLAARLSRRAGPAFHHTLWTIALFAELLLPAIPATPTQLLQAARGWLASLHHITELQPQITVTMGTPQVASTGLALPPTLLAFAAILYLAALAFFATRLAIGLHQTASLRRRAQPLALTGYASQSYHRYAKLFAVNDAHIAASAEIASPITLGIRRPTLLLPEHLDTLLPEDLDAALAHEFAHMRRRDFAKNLLYEILSLPIAFHPILWLTRARMAETRELVCDAMAANAVAGPQRYARSLLRLATQFAAQPNATPTPHAIGIFDAHPFKNFERRVMHLTHRTIELRGAARLVPAALSLVLIGAACTSALAFRQQVAAPEAPTTSGTTQTATLQPIALTIPHAGQPARSYKIEIPATPGNTNGLPAGSYVLRVSPPKTSAPTQASAAPTARISPGVIAGQRLNFVAPVYPADAKANKIQGAVVLDAIIGKDGAIKDLHILSGPPELTTAALEAVRRWTYKPYLLNGDPTEVETTITVNFSLSPSPQPEPSPAPNPSALNPQPSAPSNQVLHIGGGVKPPVVIHTAEPEYSLQAKDAKFSGNVRVYLQVDTNGHTSHVRVVKGVGMGLDEKAVEAVSQYRFKPATLGGKPVPVDLYIDVNFQIL